MPRLHENKRALLRVERVLRGSQQPGDLLTFQVPGCERCKTGDRIVAFVDTRSNEWLATGLLLAGPKLEDGVLRMEAGSATGTRQIIPPLIPFPRIEALATREVPTSLGIYMHGPLVVPGPAGLADSSIKVVLPAPDMPDLSQSLAPGPRKRLRPSSATYGTSTGLLVWATWNNGVRALDLVGEVLGPYEGDDDIAAAFLVVRPAFLDEASLQRYLDDATLPEPRYAFEIRTATAKIPLVLPSGPDRATRGTLDGRPVTALSLDPARVESAVARLSFPPDLFPRKHGTLTDSAVIVKKLLEDPAPCELARGPEKSARTPCTLHYLGVQFPPPAPPAPPVPPWPDVK